MSSNSTWETVPLNRQRSKKDVGPPSPAQSRKQGTPGRPLSRQSSAGPSAFQPSGSLFAALADAPLPDSPRGSRTENERDIIDLTDSPPRATREPSTPTPQPKHAPTPAKSAQQLAAAAATPKKNMPPKVKGYEGLAEIDLQKLRNFVEAPKSQEPLRDLAEYLDLVVGAHLKLGGPLFGSKSFSLETGEWTGPLPHLPSSAEEIITGYLQSPPLVVVSEGLTGIVKQLVEGQKKGAGSERAKKPAIEVLEAYKHLLGGMPAVGHTLLWVLAQQKAFALPQSVVRTAQESEDSPNVAASYQEAALHLFMEYVNSLKSIQQKNPALSRDFLPYIPIRDLASFLRIAVSPQSSVVMRKRKRDFLEKLRSGYNSLKDLFFGLSHAPHVIRTDPDDQVFLVLLRELKNETDEDVRAEICDVLLRVIANEQKYRPKTNATSHSTAKIGSPVLCAWVNAYESHVGESGILIDHIIRESTVGRRGRLWKKLSKSELRTTLLALREENRRLLKKIDKKAQRDKGRRSVPDSSSEMVADIKGVDRKLQTLLKRTPKRRSFSGRAFKWFIRLLFLGFIYYSVVHVACGPDSKRLCPLDHPTAKQLKVEVWDDRLVPAAHALNGYARDHVMPPVTAFVGAICDRVEPHVSPVYQKSIKPHVQKAKDKWAAMRKSNEWKQLMELQKTYFTSYVDHIKGEWHQAAVFFVDVVVPKVSEVVEDGVRWVVNEAWPIVRQETARGAVGLREGWQRTYPLFVAKIRQGRQSITHHETVRKISTSGPVLKISKAYQDHVAPAVEPMFAATAQHTAGIRAIVQEVIGMWKQGLCFGWRVLENDVDQSEWERLEDLAHSVWSAVMDRLTSGAKLLVESAERYTGVDLGFLKGKATSGYSNSRAGKPGPGKKETSRATTSTAKQAKASVSTAKPSKATPSTTSSKSSTRKTAPTSNSKPASKSQSSQSIKATQKTKPAPAPVSQPTSSATQTDRHASSKSKTTTASVSVDVSANANAKGTPVSTAPSKPSTKVEPSSAKASSESEATTATSGKSESVAKNPSTKGAEPSSAKARSESKATIATSVKSESVAKNPSSTRAESSSAKASSETKATAATSVKSESVAKNPSSERAQPSSAKASSQSKATTATSAGTESGSKKSTPSAEPEAIPKVEVTEGSGQPPPSVEATKAEQKKPETVSAAPSSAAHERDEL
ncbi:hypothetical protein HK104_000018 [Borealophlyctis nickersoniae]|nr:hypothetical protein HK104_000018 [Borealophlyctis nickersoniae]